MLRRQIAPGVLTNTHTHTVTRNERIYAGFMAPKLTANGLHAVKLLALCASLMCSSVPGTQGQVLNVLI